MNCLYKLLPNYNFFIFYFYAIEYFQILTQIIYLQNFVRILMMMIFLFDFIV